MRLQKAGLCLSWDLNSPKCPDLSAQGAYTLGECWLQVVQAPLSGGAQGPLEHDHIFPAQALRLRRDHEPPQGFSHLQNPQCPHSPPRGCSPASSPTPRGGSGGRGGFHSLVPEPGGGPPAAGRKEGIWRDFRCGCARYYSGEAAPTGHVLA